MKKYGLIGYPIAHSQSPALFRAAYDGAYPYDLIEESDFETAYRRFLSDYEGINVTAPFKELAYARADILSDEVRLIRAANLLVKTREGVKAYNSDFLAVQKWLKEICGNFPADHAPSVLIAGCGGAGKAAAIASGSLGLRTILTNRSADKALDIIAHIQALRAAGETTVSEALFEFRPLETFLQAYTEVDIVIYTLPLAIDFLSALNHTSMPGTALSSTAQPATGVDKRSTDHKGPKLPAKYILEANYKNPSFTPELLATLPDTVYTPGTTWLLYQAITGYKLFTGLAPRMDAMRNDIFFDKL